MCLKTFDSQLHTAERDIQVYKVCMKFEDPRLPHGAMVSTGFGYPYIRGEVNPTRCLKPKEAIIYLGVDGYKDCFEVEEGYHSCKDIESAKALYMYEPESEICVFTIPKGATFYEGWYNEDQYILNFVSSDIIFNETLEELEERERKELEIKLQEEELRPQQQAKAPSKSFAVWGILRGIFR